MRHADNAARTGSAQGRRWRRLLLGAALASMPAAHAQQLFAPVITSEPGTTATEGTQYVYNVTVFDADLLDTITITAGSLPGWLTLTDHGNRTATLAGTPGVADPGGHVVVLGASDGANSTEQSFQIDVEGLPDPPPVAAADAYNAAEDSELNVNRQNGVLANDSSGGGDSDDLSAVLVDDAAHGALSLNSNGSFTYEPDAGFSGTDTFTYRASDGELSSNVATVTITVSAVNDPPVATNDAYATNEGAPLTVSAAQGVLANDTDPEADALTATLTDDVDHGTLALSADGSFTYTPAPGYDGTDQFRYRAADGSAQSNAATVTITVAAVNGAPTAAADHYNATEDAVLSVNAANGVLANDSDPDGDALTAAIGGGVTNGTVALNANGAFTYTPPAGFSGSASFTYHASDGAAQSGPATVTITIAAVNDAPTFTSTAPTTVDEGARYAYQAQAVDPDGDALTFAAPVLPAWLTFTPPATIAGTPGQEHAGLHDVTITATDASAAAVAQSFRITVRAVDNPPSVAPIPDQSGTEGAPYTLELAPFVSDADTPTGNLVFAPSGPLPAGLSLTAAGTLAAAALPAASIGEHTIRFTVRDALTSVPAEFPLSVLRAGRTDLGLTIAAAPNPAGIGTPATWTLTVANNSTVAVGGVTLEAAFTGEVPFRFLGPATAGCALTPSGNATLLACTLGALAGGARIDVTLTGDGSVAGDIFASGTVAVTGGVPLDETPGNDRGSASLSIAQSVSGGAAQEIGGIDALATVAADFDQDGFDDLALVTAAGVLLLRNDVDPANASKRALAAPPIAIATRGGTAVAAADLDADGDVDLAVATGAGAENFLLVNGGDGTFTATLLAGSAEDSRAVAIGDVDGDGRLDVAFANAGADTVYRNAGGSFTRTALPRTDDSRAIVLANLFGDPAPELVTANGDGDATVYRNTAGAFALEATLATAATTSVAAEDFNGDGTADLVFGRSAGTDPATVPSDLIWLNTSGGGGRFFLSDELGASATTSVAIADFDRDGDRDVLSIGVDGSHRIHTNVGSATGTFALHPQQIGYARARRAAVGRFGVDERLDVALVGAGGVGVFYDDGAGNFGPGDVGAPTIQLLGEATVTVVVAEPYTDLGATATDSTDGDLTAKVVTTNPVDTAVIGTYTVTYDVTDLSGNAAAPVTRTVNVQTRDASGGGGGGAAGAVLAALLAAAVALRRRPRRERLGRSRGGVFRDYKSLFISHL